MLSWLIVVLGYAVGKRARFHIPSSLSMLGSSESNRVAVLALYPLALLASLWADSTNQVAVLNLTVGIRTLLFVWVVHAAWSGQLDQKAKVATLALIVPVELALFVRLADGVFVRPIRLWLPARHHLCGHTSPRSNYCASDSLGVVCCPPTREGNVSSGHLEH